MDLACVNELKSLQAKKKKRATKNPQNPGSWMPLQCQSGLIRVCSNGVLSVLSLMSTQSFRVSIFVPHNRAHEYSLFFPPPFQSLFWSLWNSPAQHRIMCRTAHGWSGHCRNPFTFTVTSVVTATVPKIITRGPAYAHAEAYLEAARISPSFDALHTSPLFVFCACISPTQLCLFSYLTHFAEGCAACQSFGVIC